MLASALLAATLVLENCSACLVRGQEVVLCSPHAAEDRVVITREAKRVRSGDGDQSIAALEAIAALTRAHENAPSPRVVKALAAGLQHESLAVRRRAAELLGPPQHATDALRTLLAALKDLDAEVRATNEELRRALAGFGPAKPKKGSKKDGIDLKELEGVLRATNESLEATTRGLQALGRRAVLAERLGDFPDDRVVEALVLSEEISASDAGTRSLLLLGSRPAIEAVLSSLESWEARPAPTEEKAHASHAARGELVRGGLATLAARNGLPLPDSPTHAGWQAWWRTHGSTFPAALPGIRGPVW
jgi:hypothetical protein